MFQNGLAKSDALGRAPFKGRSIPSEAGERPERDVKLQDVNAHRERLCDAARRAAG